VEGGLVRTIGVAIGIPEPWGSQLDQHRAGAGDPMAAFIPAHLTLLGPTEIQADLMPKVEEHLAAVATGHRPFRVHLLGTGTFRPVTQVVFVALAAGADECARLAADVRLGPLEVTLRFPYHPHVTVAHDIPAAALDAIFERLSTFEARFPVDGFTLYEHGADGRWHPQRHFGLAGGTLAP
jgi:2'-5' RNA ligase